MTKHTTLSVSRRGFFLTTAVVAGGFAIGCAPAGDAAKAAGAVFNPFVRIGADGVVTVIAKHIEFGQGTHTGLAAIVAEELDADWSKVKAEAAPADLDVYYNLAFGKGAMGTGGSTAIANSWPQYRAAAAGARAMLVEAAAKKLGADAASLTVKDGVVSTADGKSATFGELAAAAAKLKPPAEPKLKDPGQFTLIGTDRVRRLDNTEKTTGQPIFTIDKKPAGANTALIARPPKFGATVKSFDAAEAEKVPGVVKVVQVPSGVAVVAKDFWSAKKGRDALKVEWDFAKAETRSSAQLFDEFKKLAATTGPEKVQSKGDAAAAMKKAARVVKGTFEFPYLAHATMEPMNAIAQIKDGGVQLWTGSQFPTMDKPAAAGIAGVDPSKVKIETLLTGGSFGRRANFQADFVSDAVNVAKAMGDGLPVLVQWTREDDMTGGKYRPMVVHHVEAGLDKAGNIIAWKHVIVSQPILAGTPFSPPGAPDGSVVEGAWKSPYLEVIADHDLTAHYAQVGVPVLWWRSVGHTHTAHAMEHMIDLCARAARKDPVAYRRQMLANAPRHLGALNLAVEKAGYPKTLGRGHSIGVAVHESFGSVVAMVADVTMVDGAPKVHKVTAAVDCGIAVAPDQIRAQIEGGLGYGLGAALYDQITLTDGEVDQKNFDTYPALRITDMPVVDTHIVASANPPTGVGEPGTPPITPAVANAVLAATGKATFKLPFKPA